MVCQLCIHVRRLSEKFPRAVVDLHSVRGGSLILEFIRSGGSIYHVRRRPERSQSGVPKDMLQTYREPRYSYKNNMHSNKNLQVKDNLFLGSLPFLAPCGET